jgi:putative ABC transport system permease protein
MMLGIALKILVGDRGKYLGVVLGLVFTTFFMTQQPAMFFGILNRTYGFLSDSGLIDIWVMDPMVQYVDDVKPLSDTAVARVRGIEGVGWAVPIYKGNVSVRLADGNFQNSVLIGLDDATLIGAPAVMVSGSPADLKRADGVIVSQDGAAGRLAHPNPVAGRPPIPLQLGDVIEMNDRRAVVVGICKSTTNTNSQPTLYTTYSRALTYAPSARKMLSFVLVKAKSGFEIPALIDNIRRWTGLAAYTREEFEQKTLLYFLKNSMAITLFGLSALIGFFIGGLIAGQTFYNFTLENLRYFGVMKAMGATNGILLRMIMVQAFAAGAVGYGIGIGLVCILGVMLDARFPFQMSWALLLVSAAAVIVLCVAASALSIWKVMRLEPASVFKA